MRRTKGLVFVLALALMVFGLVAVANAATFSDVAADNAAYKDISKLSALSIVNGYPDGTFGPDKAVTRAEFAKIAVTMAGLKNSAEYLASSASQFTDVAAGQWYTGWVNVAASQGFLKGYPDGTFKPNANVTAAEAITICVRLLGYDDRLPGDWPVDYLAEASKLGITDDLSFVASAAANRGLIAQISSATLDENIVSYDNDKEDFLEKAPVKSLLADGFSDSSLFEDVLVTAVKFDGDAYVMDTIDPNPKDHPEKADKDVDETNASTTLTDDVVVAGVPSAFTLEGRMVDYIVNDDGDAVYVQLTDDIKAPVFGKIDDYTSDTVTIDDTDYDMNTDFFVCLSHMTDIGPVQSLNDKSDALSGAAVITPLKDQKVTLYFDDDSNVVFIYRTSPDAAKVVDEVGTDRIDLKQGGTIKDLGPDDDSIILKNGVPIALADVKPGDVIYDVKSADGKVARGFDRYVSIVDNTVEGDFSKYYPGTSPEGTVGDTKYDFASGAGLYLEDGSGDEVTDINDLVGSTVTAKLDGNKEVAYITGATTDNGGLYGVIVDAGKYDGKGSSQNWVEIYTKDGQDVTYDFDSDYFDDHFDIDRGDDADLYNVVGSDADDTSADNANINIGKLVKYSLNADGEIDSIKDCSTGATSIEGTYAKNVGDDVTIDDAEKDNDRVKDASGSYRDVTDSTVVIDLRYDNTDGSVDPVLATWADVEDAGDTNMDVYYDDDVAKYLVIWEPDGITAAGNYGVFVDYYQDGSDTYVSMYQDGELKEYKYTAGGEDTFVAGTIYNFKVTDDKISDVTEYTEGNDTGTFDEDFHKSTVVADRNSNNFQLAGNDEGAYYKVNDDTMVVLMDGDDVDTLGSYGDVSKDDDVVVLTGEPGSSDDGIALIIVVQDLSNTTPEETVDSGVNVTYINSTGTRVEIDGDIYSMDEDTVLKDADGRTIAIGNEDIQKYIVDNNAIDDEIGFDFKSDSDGLITELSLVDNGGAVEPTLEGITLELDPATVEVGSTEADVDATVTAEYSDNTEDDVTADADVDFSDVDFATAGEYTVTATFEGETDTATLTVEDNNVPAVASIDSISGTSFAQALMAYTITVANPVNVDSYIVKAGDTVLQASDLTVNADMTTIKFTPMVVGVAGELTITVTPVNANGVQGTAKTLDTLFY